MKTIYLSGIVGYEITADSIREQINEKSSEKLQVIVNSFGGYVIDAFEIFNIFSMYRGEVEFVINGVAASAMSYIIMSGDKISAFKNSIFMAHPAQAVAFGDADAIQREADIARSMDNVLAEAYTGRFKKSKEEILAAMKNEIWLIGWEALTDAGVIDNVIDSPDELMLEAGSEEIKQQIIFANSEMEKLSDQEKRQNAVLSIIQTSNRMMRDPEKMKSNSMKAAAILQNFKPAEKPVENKFINSHKEERMDLQKFLAENPDAKAEYENNLLSAEATGKAKAENANVEEIKLTERTRIVAILAQADIELNETITAALDSDQDVKDYALAELGRQKAMRTGEKKNVFGALTPKTIPAEQDATGADDFQAKLDAAAAKLKNEGGKK